MEKYEMALRKNMKWTKRNISEFIFISNILDTHTSPPTKLMRTSKLSSVQHLATNRWVDKNPNQRIYMDNQGMYLNEHTSSSMKSVPLYEKQNTDAYDVKELWGPPGRQMEVDRKDKFKVDQWVTSNGDVKVSRLYNPPINAQYQLPNRYPIGDRYRDDTKITQNIDPWGAKETIYDPPLQKDGWLEGFDNTPRRKLIKEIPPISTLNPPRPLSQALNIDANYVLRKANMDGKVEKRNMKNEKGKLYIPSFLPPKSKEEPFNIQRDFDIINEKNDFPRLDPPRPLIAKFNPQSFDNPESPTLMKRSKQRPMRRIVLRFNIGPFIRINGEKIYTQELIDQADDIFTFQPPDDEFWNRLYYENQSNLFENMILDSLNKEETLESYKFIPLSTYKACAVLFKKIIGDDRELPSIPDDIFKERLFYAAYLNSIFDYIKDFINENEVIITVEQRDISGIETRPKEYRLKYE